MSRARRVAVRSSISSGRTRIRTSRPACTANERSTPSKLSAIACRSSRRFTYVSIDSPRAPGRDALIASATWTIGASRQAYSTSWWWAAMPLTTLNGRLWRQATRLDDVVEHVLSVARAVLEPPEQLDDLGGEARHAGLVGRRLAGLADDEVDLGARLGHDLLDAARMDPAIGQ